ncbi:MULTISPECIES: glycerate kinase [unclassified Arthrobacter]|uniref:glycerate kinase family protein n=1 Tax=unclassified Arthrobacter TaxID=235627 RepID=UPI001C85E168|nr:glycerate kinase [Arthrobacter sp. MAHUQ-56]MBX7445946.1 glycerate kinase [Arthrobacter sp. MAHUQ-56]
MDEPHKHASPLRVLIAPDSFKGTLTAREAATAIAEGWKSVRPHDELDLAPLADGGEGTLDAVAGAMPDSVRSSIEGATGPDGKARRGEWLKLPGSVAVVELAQIAGLPFMDQLAPLTATTRGVGDIIRAAVEDGAREVWLALGGSASTDAGLGALRALGAVALDATGKDIPEGGAGLLEVAALDFARLLPIPGGITLLSDVTAPLTGPHGAAAVFGPQKGATPEQVEALDQGLQAFALLAGLSPDIAGAGAAGGAGYGFMAAYGAGVESGADRIGELVQLDRRIRQADIVITGEGSFDGQSRIGKLVGNVLQRAAEAGVQSGVIAGRIAADPGTWAAGLDELAGDGPTAMKDAARWAAAAAKRAAEELGTRKRTPVGPAA